MKAIITTIFLFTTLWVNALPKDSTLIFRVEDSVKATSFIADVNIGSLTKRESNAGLVSDHVKLLLERERNKGYVSFEFPDNAEIVATGINTKKEKGEIEWKFNWDVNTTYRLLIATAIDTAENFKLFTGYIFLPHEQKWKLIGTCKIKGERNYLQQAGLVYSTGNKSNPQAEFNNVWVQSGAGSWKKLGHQFDHSAPPNISPLVNVDSIAQFQKDNEIIEKAIAKGITDVKNNIEGVYYYISEEGNGQQFSLDDSITVKYQLRIFGTTEVISGSTKETYTFKLKSLIKAWQLAVPLVKTGGKIKLVIPSGLAYSIRTRAPKIPPNSILEFEIEVLDKK